MADLPRRRILIFGVSGQVGGALLRTAWPSGTELVPLDRRAADFTRPEKLGEIVTSRRPDAVIVAAAHTAVDRAEGEESLAYQVNATAPGRIAAAAAKLGAPVVLFSTDYVFDGAKAAPYVEDDRTGPLNAYGRSKLAGEAGVRAANPRHLILRTSWVYGASGTNFLRSMVELARSRDRVSVVADQRGCPTYAPDLAVATARAVLALTDTPGLAGTYHLVGTTPTSWHGFAEAIFGALRARGLPTPENVPVRSEDMPRPARRPGNSVLCCDRFAAAFGVRLPGFEARLPEALDTILAGEPARRVRAS